MLGKIITAVRKRAMPQSALFAIRLIYYNAEQVGISTKEDLPIEYTKDLRFLGAVFGLIEFMHAYYQDKGDVFDAFEKVVNNIFHDNSAIAFKTFSGGVSSQEFSNAVFEVEEYLDQVTGEVSHSLVEETEEKLLFFVKYL